MRIDFLRTGGFAGTRLQATIRTETLPPAEAVELQELVAAADFFRLPRMAPRSGSAADQFTYRITVVANLLHRHTIQTTDAAAPPSLQPLIQRLMQLARLAR